MGEQHFLSSGPLLDKDGNLAECGYAYSLLKTYSRSAIKARKGRIKEWDYYYVGNKDRGIGLTIDDNGYMDLCSASVLDFRKPGVSERMVTHPFSYGKRALPSSSAVGDTFYHDKKVEMRFTHEGNKRHLYCVWPKFDKEGRELRVDLFLEETTDGKSMVIATPFKKKRHFYYNQKINNLKSTGYAKLGEDFLDFNKDSYGVLDWGRGVWTYQNLWYWSSLNAIQDNHTIGWNLGYGFGDTSAASENMFFYDQDAYKLGDVKFDIPMDEKAHDDYLKPWKFRSNDGAIDLTFTPVLDRAGGANLLLLRSDQHQCFGTFKGFIKADGKTFTIVNLPGFAEKVFNRW